MKLSAAILIVLGSFTLGVSVLADEPDKVTICHAAGREGTTHYETLTLSSNAVFKDQGGHFYENGTPQAGHEQDYIGPCNSDTTFPTTTPPTTSEPQPTTTNGGTTSTTLASTETSAPETSTTSSPTTSLPTSSSEPSLPPAPTTAPSLSITEPSTTSPVVALTTPPVPKRSLPKTGNGTGQAAQIALGLLVMGGGATLIARRR